MAADKNIADRLPLILLVANLVGIIVLGGLLLSRPQTTASTDEEIRNLARKVAIMADTIADLNAEVAEVSAKTEDYLAHEAGAIGGGQVPDEKPRIAKLEWRKGRILHVAKLESRLAVKKSLPQIALNTVFPWPTTIRNRMKDLIGKQVVIKAGPNPKAKSIKAVVVQLIRAPRKRTMAGHVNRPVMRALQLDPGRTGRATIWIAQSPST